MEEAFEETIPIDESKLTFTRSTLRIELRIEPAPLKPTICSYCGEMSVKRHEAIFSKPFSNPQKLTLFINSLVLFLLYLGFYAAVDHSAWYKQALQSTRDLADAGWFFIIIVYLFIIDKYSSGKNTRKFYSLDYHLCDRCNQRNKWLNIILYSVGVLAALWLVVSLMFIGKVWGSPNMVFKIGWVVSGPLSILLLWSLNRLSVRWRGFEVHALITPSRLVLKFYNYAVGKKCVAD